MGLRLQKREKAENSTARWASGHGISDDGMIPEQVLAVRAKEISGHRDEAEWHG